MSGDDHPNLGATPTRPRAVPPTPSQGVAPRSPSTAPVGRGGLAGASPQPPVAVSPAPGATGPILQELAAELDRLNRLDRKAGCDPHDRAAAERISHMARLLVMARYCERNELPPRRVLLALAVQAVGWITTLEEQP